MKTYRLVIEALSPFLTPFDSDSLFGAICWAIRWNKGERELEEFIDSYQNKPPFLISNGFRHDYLPFPILPGLSREEIRNLIERKYGSVGPQDYRKGLEKIKKIRRVKYIQREVFGKYANNFSEKRIVEDVFKKKLNNFLEFNEEKNEKEDNNYFKIKDVYHNQINRLTGNVNVGGLYTQTETEYLSLIDIYIRTDNADYFREIFKTLETEGFGKRRSTGKGQFKIIENLVEDKIPTATQANYYLTLSNYVPSERVEGYYQLAVKRGKLGSVFASLSDYSPWKSPFVMYKPGSIFKKTSRKYYGRLLKGIHSELEQIVQYGYAFDIGVKIDENS